MKCETCGDEVEIGSWPFCKGPGSHGKPSFVEVGDEIDEVIENLGPRPIRFRSREEKRLYMKQHGYVEKVRHVPHPRGNRFNHTTDWGAATDPVTAANVRELLERAFVQGPSRDDGIAVDPQAAERMEQKVRELYR